jgi:hypothetical protein
MSTVKQRFDAFLSNIQLTDAQLDDAITKHTGVRKTLHNTYYVSQSNLKEALAESLYTDAIRQSYKSNTIELAESKSTSLSTSLLVGSYGKNTEIRPPSDIDILFKMPSSHFSRYDTNAYNGQSQLLQDVKKVLVKTYPSTSIRADGQVVIIPFQSYQVEVLPAFETIVDGLFKFPDTNKGGSWRHTNPIAEKRNLSNSNKRSNGNTVRLVKMMKAWKRECSVPIKSLVLEFYAIEFLQSWRHFDESSMYYDRMVRDFLGSLIWATNAVRVVPGVTETVNFGDAWKSKTQTAYDRAVKACEYEGKDERINATTEWRKIFGSQFNY